MNTLVVLHFGFLIAEAVIVVVAVLQVLASEVCALDQRRDAPN